MDFANRMRQFGKRYPNAGNKQTDIFIKRIMEIGKQINGLNSQQLIMKDYSMRTI